MTHFKSTAHSLNNLSETNCIYDSSQIDSKFITQLEDLEQLLGQLQAEQAAAHAALPAARRVLAAAKKLAPCTSSMSRAYASGVHAKPVSRIVSELQSDWVLSEDCV